MRWTDINRQRKDYPLNRQKPKYVQTPDPNIPNNDNLFDEISGEVLTLWDHNQSQIEVDTYDVYPIQFQIKPGRKFYLFEIDPFELDMMRGDIVMGDITSFALDRTQKINNQIESDVANDEMVFDGNFNKSLSTIADDNDAVLADLKNPYFTIERCPVEFDINRTIDIVFEGYVAENLRKTGNSADLDFWLFD